MDAKELERLERALKSFPDNAENTINEVLHDEASPLLQESIKRLMPVSGRQWSGKKAPAKMGKSLTDEKENLSITIKTTKNYNYLYFPDDGTNTRRHAGNKQFFKRGGEAKQSEIVDRCISRLVKEF